MLVSSEIMYFAHVVLCLILLQVAVTSPISHLKPLSPEDAARLASWKPGYQPMWQISGQIQGDMLLTPDQRNGVIDTRLRWPNREIPYEISNDFTEDEKKFIGDVLSNEYPRSCVTVRPRTSADGDYVYVTGQNTGCWSWVGRLGGRQELNLQRNGCLWTSTVIHEFLHAAGFYHQQSATERDDWVTIQWGNVQAGTEHNFDKYPSSIISSFGEQYDYGSVMHYDAYAFSQNGQKTILTRDPNVEIGKAERMTDVDIRKLNKMYNCQ